MPSCCEDLLPPASLHEASSSVRYSFRLRVCQTHLKAAEVDWEGTPVRFCQARAPCMLSVGPSLTPLPHLAFLQKCAKFEPISAFKVRPHRFARSRAPLHLTCRPHLTCSHLSPPSPPQLRNRTCERTLCAQKQRVSAGKSARRAASRVPATTLFPSISSSPSSHALSGDAPSHGGTDAGSLEDTQKRSTDSDTSSEDCQASLKRLQEALCAAPQAGQPALRPPSFSAHLAQAVARFNHAQPLQRIASSSSGTALAGWGWGGRGDGSELMLMDEMMDALLNQQSALATASLATCHMHCELKLHELLPEQLPASLAASLGGWGGWDGAQLPCAGGLGLAALEAAPQPGCTRLSLTAALRREAVVSGDGGGGGGSTTVPPLDARLLLQHLLADPGAQALRSGCVQLAFAGGGVASAVDGQLQAAAAHAGGARPQEQLPPALPPLTPLALCSAHPQRLSSAQPCVAPAGGAWRLRCRLHGQQYASLMAHRLLHGAPVEALLPAVAGAEGMLLVDCMAVEGPPGTHATLSPFAAPTACVMTACPHIAAEVNTLARMLLGGGEGAERRRAMVQGAVRAIGCALRPDSCPPAIAVAALRVAVEHGMRHLTLRLLRGGATLAAARGACAAPGAWTLLHHAARGGDAFCCEAVLCAGGAEGLLGRWEDASAGATPWQLLLRSEALREAAQEADTAHAEEEVDAGADAASQRRLLVEAYEGDQARLAFKAHLPLFLLGHAILVLRLVTMAAVQALSGGAPSRAALEALRRTDGVLRPPWHVWQTVYFRRWDTSPVWLHVPAFLAAVWLRFTPRGQRAFLGRPNTANALLFGAVFLITPLFMESRVRQVYGFTQADCMGVPRDGVALEVAIALGMSALRMRLPTHIALIFARALQIGLASVVLAAPVSMHGDVMGSLYQPLCFAMVAAAMLAYADYSAWGAWLRTRQLKAAKAE